MGRIVPVKGAAVPNTTTAESKRIDARTFEAQGKVSGKPTVMTRVNGKTSRPLLRAVKTRRANRSRTRIVADRQQP